MTMEVEGADTYKRMVSFFYLLMRDHLSIGLVNELLKDLLTADKRIFSDAILLAKAESMAQQMAAGKYVVKDIVARWDMPPADVVDVVSADLAEVAAKGENLVEWFNNKSPGETNGDPTRKLLVTKKNKGLKVRKKKEMDK